MQQGDAFAIDLRQGGGGGGGQKAAWNPGWKSRGLVSKQPPFPMVGPPRFMLLDEEQSRARSFKHDGMQQRGGLGGGSRGILDTQQGSQIPPWQHNPGQGPRGHPRGGHLTLHTSGSGFLIYGGRGGE